MNSEPQLYEKFIAFVDILGFESTVESLERPQGAQLSDLLKFCSKLAQESHKKNVADHGPVICPESRYNSRDLDYEVTQVSDCVVVSTEVSPAGIMNLLQHVSACVFGLMTKGVMVRGYITRGNIYHRGGQFIGSGYQNAWRMEKNVKAFRLPLDPTSTAQIKSIRRNRGLHRRFRLYPLHFRDSGDGQAVCSRQFGGKATPAAWKTFPTCP